MDQQPYLAVIFAFSAVFWNESDWNLCPDFVALYRL